MQIYMSPFRLENYPLRAKDVLYTGVEAFAAELNTVSMGTFNLCSCSIGMAEHASYEAITHAQNVSCTATRHDFAQVRANFVDSYARQRTRSGAGAAKQVVLHTGSLTVGPLISYEATFFPISPAARCNSAPSWRLTRV